MKDLMLTNDDLDPVVSEMDEVFILSDAISESTEVRVTVNSLRNLGVPRLGGDVVGLDLKRAISRSKEKQMANRLRGKWQLSLAGPLGLEKQRLSYLPKKAQRL